MPFTSNKPVDRKKSLIILAVVAVILLLAGFGIYTSRQKSSGPIEYDDPFSGETISDPDNKSPEQQVSETAGHVYLGFSKLLDVGVTEFQLEAAKIAFVSFSKQKGYKTPVEISIDVSSIKQSSFDRESSDPTRSITFDVVTNRSERFQSVLSFAELKSARLVLSQDGKQVFDSGVIESDKLGD